MEFCGQGDRMIKKSILTSLTDEDLAKIPPIPNEEIRQVLEQGRKDRLAAEACTNAKVWSGIYFRGAIA